MFDNKIEKVKSKQSVLVDSMLEKIISKQDYSEKRAELDLELENLEKGKLELQTSKGVPIETVKDRIKHLKEQVNNSLYKEKGDNSFINLPTK